MVETVGKRTGVLAGVLAKLEGLVSPVDRRLQVTQYRIDPAQCGKLAGLALAHDNVRMRAAGIDHAGEAAEAVAEHAGARNEVRAGPVSHRLDGERWHRRHLDAHRVALLIERHGSDERHLVRRAAPADAGQFSTEVGVVDQDLPSQWRCGIAVGHGSHDLLMHQPCTAIADAELTHQGQRGEACLGLADQVDRQELHPQRQLGAVHHRAGGQRCLMATFSALEERPTFVLNAAMLPRLAPRTDEPCRPSKPAQFVGALRLRPVSVHELVHRHSTLELDSVDRHGHRSVKEGDQHLKSEAQAVSQRMLVPNQVVRCTIARQARSE